MLRLWCGLQGADPALNRFYLRDPMKMTKKVAQKATSAALDVAKQTADVSMAAARQAVRDWPFDAARAPTLATPTQPHLGVGHKLASCPDARSYPRRQSSC